MAAYRPQVARFLRFTVVGGIGFAIEASVITLLGRWFGWDAIASRAISFPLAVLATWLLNRVYTYRSDNPPVEEGARYFAVQVVGALSNLATYAACIRYLPGMGSWPVLCLAVGAAVGLVVNYALSSALVFVRSRRFDERS